MPCITGKGCKNCAECFGCHAMKETGAVGNCRPKSSRICPIEKWVRKAEEQAIKSIGGLSGLPNGYPAQAYRPNGGPGGLQDSTLNQAHKPTGGPSGLQNGYITQAHKPTGGPSGLQNIDPAPSTPYISKTILGGSTSYVIKGDHVISFDQSGPHIRFPQFSGLTFSSMESAFEYFEAHTKLQKQRVAPSPVGQSAKHPAWKTRHVGDRVWQFDNSLESVNAKRVFSPSDAIHPSSPISPHEIPPQTLFTDSTPHAQSLQSQPSARIPTLRTTSSSFRQEPLPSPTPSIQAKALPECPIMPPIHHEISPPASLSVDDDIIAQPPIHYDYSPPPPLSTNDEILAQPPIHHDYSPPSPLFIDDEMLAQPQSSYGSYPPLPSYSTSAFPQTLAKKDKRVLGVPLTADIDEIRAGFWLRVLQYNVDRSQAANLEERAIAAMKLTRAEEAVNRLCGS